MNTNDIIGSLGVGLILLAYCCNIFGIIRRKGILYFLMNAVGAGLACYASVLINYIPFIILEGVWTVVSVIGLIRVVKKN